MLRNLVRLTVLALLVHAGARVGPEFWQYLQFKDAVAEVATYASRATPEQVRERVLALAREHQVPITSEDVSVTRKGTTTYVFTAWTAQLEYLPRRFHAHDFVVDVEGRSDRTGGLAP